MKDLSPERWQQIDALFEAALARPPDQRAAFLEQACSGDAALRDEVFALIESDSEAEHALGESATHFAETLLSDLESDLDDGFDADRNGERRIGPYRLLEEIGRGGMGTVYRARRDDHLYQRQVALKLVKRGMDSDEILRRFRYERQILAGLEHPHIARLYDGGMHDDGRPYLAMEYVDGVTIDRYCDARKLNVEQRLSLFTTVCEAVQYAHQNLVVHRDLKPSNILVTDPDGGLPGTGQVKLLDFGIAKLLSDEPPDVTVPITQTGVRVMTPEYASPEQARGDAITTASDVYALGVILYELLTGRRPFEDTPATSAGAGAAEHTPVRPSTAVTRAMERRRRDGTTETVTPEALSTSRSTSLDRLQRRLRGDLDTIMLKALQHEPERRYASAEAFVEDIKRHLAGLPVQARPDTPGYRLRKFIQRHKAGVGAAAAFVVLLLAFAVAMLLQAQRIAAERDVARQERDKAAEVAAFLENLFDASDPFLEERLDTMQVHTLLLRGAGQVQDSLTDQPLVQAQMLTVIGRVYGRLGLDEEALPLLRQALAARRRLLGALHPEVAESLTELGTVLYDRGLYDEAEAAFREALAIRTTLNGTDHAAVAEAMNNHGLALHALGKHDEAEALFREALAIQQNVLGEEHASVAATLSTLASLLEDQGAHDESETHHRASLAMRRALYNPNHPNIAVGLNNLAIFLRNQLRYDEAEPLLREAIRINRARLDPEHPHLITDLNILASVLRGKGDYEAADSLFREVLALRRKRLGPAHPDVSITLDSYAALLKEKGDFEGAERLQREAIAIARRAFGDEHMAVAITTGKLASILKALGDNAQALPVYRESLALLERLLPPDHPSTAVLRSNMAECLINLARYQEAEPLFLESYRTLLETRGQDDRLTQSTVRYLVTLYKAWGKPDKVAEYLALLAVTEP